MNSIIEDEIISIEECGEIETMDIEVGGNHLFFANDILTHNSAYNDKENSTLANISESLKKVEHADHIALIKNLIEEKDEENIQRRPEVGDFKIDILKNRSGPKNVYAKLKSNFSKFRIYDENSPDHNPTFEIPKEKHIPGEVF